jgi:hypothetical protein
MAQGDQEFEKTVKTIKFYLPGRGEKAVLSLWTTVIMMKNEGLEEYECCNNKNIGMEKWVV